MGQLSRDAPSCYTILPFSTTQQLLLWECDAPPRLRYVNTSSSVDKAVWGGYATFRRYSLAEASVSLGVGSEEL